MTPGTPITAPITRNGALRAVAGVVLGELPGGRLSLALEGQALRCSRSASAVTVCDGAPMVGVAARHRNLAPAFDWSAHPCTGGPRG